MEGALHSLRDIEGVLGSFVLDAQGTLLARDMPSMFDQETLRLASIRLSQLRSALEANGDGFDGCTARFGNHLLVLRAADAHTLCVLCPLGVNLNTLQMGLNLVARRVSGKDERRSVPLPPRSSEPPASSLPPMAALAETHRPSAESAARVAERQELVPTEPEPSRFFRGRPVP